MENLHDQRKIYDKYHISDEEMVKSPFSLFTNWYHEAVACKEIEEANAMSLSTIDKDHCPRTRVVLLKEFSDQGFVFFTNYNSFKGQAIGAHPKACIHFFWPALQRQVCIKANLVKVPEADSDLYFSERPKGSQLGALASMQSTEIPSRAYLEEKITALENEYENKKVERPLYWGGYLAKPYEIEFWQGRPNRLHDRILYKIEETVGWQAVRLSP